MSETPRPRVAVFKMASCDGCQLQFLDAEQALLELAGAIEIVEQEQQRHRIGSARHSDRDARRRAREIVIPDRTEDDAVKCQV